MRFTVYDRGEGHDLLDTEEGRYSVYDMQTQRHLISVDSFRVAFDLTDGMNDVIEAARQRATP